MWSRQIVLYQYLSVSVGICRYPLRRAGKKKPHNFVWRWRRVACRPTMNSKPAPGGIQVQLPTHAAQFIVNAGADLQAS
jgi:hypothetical protein